MRSKLIYMCKIDKSESDDNSELQSMGINAITIDNDDFDNVTIGVRFNTRVKLRMKSREERARLVRKASQKIHSSNLESVGSLSNSPSTEY